MHAQNLTHVRNGNYTLVKTQIKSVLSTGWCVSQLLLHMFSLHMLRPTATPMLLLLVRANLVNTSSNGVSCLFCPVPLTIISILGTLLDLLLVDLVLVFESFTLAGGRLPVHSLLLQRILVVRFTPLASFLQAGNATMGVYICCVASNTSSILVAGGLTLASFCSLTF